MLTIAWLFIKTSITKIVPAIVEHWRIILIGLICWYAYSQKTAHEASVQELKAFKASIAQLAAKQIQENEIKRIKAESAIKASQLIHSKQIEDIRNAYIKTNKLNTITITDLRKQLRDRLGSSLDLPEVVIDTQRTPVEWSDSYRTLDSQYKTLREACTITTVDYNALRSWADTACSTVGCE